jgi:hypothetical protein
MARYRTKSTVVEAVRLDLDDRQATRGLLESMGATPGEFDMPVVAGKACWWRQTFPNGFDKEPVFQLVIATLDGEVTANNGDWIIRGVGGDFYPCQSDAFEATYERAA